MPRSGLVESQQRERRAGRCPATARPLRRVAPSCPATVAGPPQRSSAMSKRHDPAAELFTIAAEARARGNARRTEIDQEHQRTAPLSEVREAIAALQFYPGPSDSTPHSAGRDWVLLLQNLYESLEKARHLGLLEQLTDRGEGRRAVRRLLRLIGAGQCEKAAEFLSNIDAPVEYQGADGRPTWEGNLDWELARDLSRHLPEDLSALLPPEHPRKPPDVVPQAGA